MEMKSILLLGFIFFPFAFGIIPGLYNSIMRQYKLQGLRFREDRHLGNLPINEAYDFIVVGSGPGGSAVTNRLTEIPDWSVLLLEAGSEETIYNDIPHSNPFWHLSEYSWRYKQEMDPRYCKGMDDHVCWWPSGKGVGGATIINGMIFTRGNVKDFNGWAEQGNPGWSYDDILPYFLKVENTTIREFKDSPYHSTTGPVKIEYAYNTKLGKGMIDAGRELGYQEVDYNDPSTPVGFGRVQATMDRGKRFSAASAYLLPIKFRENFHVARRAHVTKIIIDPTTKKATGVEFIKKGRRRVVYARKEVIVSAGAFDSPKLLMLSGVGPKEHLQQLGIPVIQDLRVGDNLQEHIANLGLTFLINTTDAFTLPSLLRNAVPDLAQWFKDGSGRMSSMGVEGFGYVRSKYSNDETIPDLELIFVDISLASDGGIWFRDTMGISDSTYLPLFEKIKYKPSFSIWPMILYPKSKGTVRLRSRDPSSPPVIRGNFLSDPYDINVITEGMKIAIQLANTRGFQRFGTTIYKEPVPGCENFIFGSDDYWECSLRYLPVQLHHQCGTCKMGPDPSKDVVDPRLRVHGISGLRVADASIIPTITGGHTMAPAYMIGEKAADLIKEDWGRLGK